MGGDSMRISNIYEDQIYKLSTKLHKLNYYNMSSNILNVLDDIEYLAKLSKGKFIYYYKSEDDLKSTINVLVPEIENHKNNILFHVIYDILIINYIYHQKESFNSYNSTQPIFIKHPEIIKKVSKNGKSEYFSSTYFKYIGPRCDQHQNVFLGVKYNDSIFEVPESSSPTIEVLYSFLFSRYKNFDIKVTPFKIHNNSDVSIYCRHGVIQPINPKCLSHFELSRRYTGGYYDFSYPNPKYEGSKIYMLDYKLSNKIALENKRLEVILKHRKQDLSMMLEEIFYDEFHQQIVGKCIHLDIIDAYGKDITKMKMKHIDLAINIYINENINIRLNQRISDGFKVTDADYRTHLIRLEEIPFLDMIKIVYLFMDSKSLVIDWIDNQFGNSINVSEYLI